MGLTMRVEQLFETDASVDLCGVELLVTKDGLDRANVRAVVVHQRGHRVTEDVASSRFVYTSPLNVAAPVLGQRIGIEGRTVNGKE